MTRQLGRPERVKAFCPLLRETEQRLAIWVWPIGGRLTSYSVQACRYRSSHLPRLRVQGGDTSGMGTTPRLTDVSGLGLSDTGSDSPVAVVAFTPRDLLTREGYGVPRRQPPGDPVPFGGQVL